MRRDRSHLTVYVWCVAGIVGALVFAYLVLCSAHVL